MSVRIAYPLALLVALSVATQAAAATPSIDGLANSAGKSTISNARLRAYAAVLVAVEKIRSGVATRSAALLPADRTSLQAQADAQIQQELTSHDLDRTQFDAISAAIDRRPELQRQVHQFVMEDLVGT